MIIKYIHQHIHVTMFHTCERLHFRFELVHILNPIIPPVDMSPMLNGCYNTIMECPSKMSTYLWHCNINTLVMINMTSYFILWYSILYSYRKHCLATSCFIYLVWCNATMFTTCKHVSCVWPSRCFLTM